MNRQTEVNSFLLCAGLTRDPHKRRDIRGPSGGADLQRRSGEDRRALDPTIFRRFLYAVRKFDSLKKYSRR